MKRLWKLLAVAAVTLLVLMLTGAYGVVKEQIIFHARVIKLYTQEPDAQLAMPLENISKRQIADTWRASRGVDRKHEGQDIFAPRGTPILSATNGLVYRIGENNLGGQTVSVIGAGGRLYYYAHLDSYARGLEVGDPVSTRTVLGYVGTTGNAQGTPPHSKAALNIDSQSSFGLLFTTFYTPIGRSKRIPCDPGFSLSRLLYSLYSFQFFSWRPDHKR